MNPLICLMGPTASGKTALAMQLLQHFPFEIISVDSAMIYQDMNIGTAKPTREELQAAPHHLIDICTPLETYSAAEFCAAVDTLSQNIQARGKIPLLVGGTMMYFRALSQGLCALPEANEAIRETLTAYANKHGQLAMHDWLKQVDPASALRIHANDTQRTQRALEVFLTTERPLSEYLREEQPKRACLLLSLFPARRIWLHDRIAARFTQMLSDGFLDEVEALKAHWSVTPQHVSMKCVGYRQALDYLAGMMDHSTFEAQGIAATRQLAKRQLTWLRNWDNIVHFDPEETTLKAEILTVLSKYLNK